MNDNVIMYTPNGTQNYINWMKFFKKETHETKYIYCSLFSS